MSLATSKNQMMEHWLFEMHHHRNSPKDCIHAINHVQEACGRPGNSQIKEDRLYCRQRIVPQERYHVYNPAWDSKRLTTHNLKIILLVSYFLSVMGMRVLTRARSRTILKSLANEFGYVLSRLTKWRFTIFNSIL